MRSLVVLGVVHSTLCPGSWILSRTPTVPSLSVCLLRIEEKQDWCNDGLLSSVHLAGAESFHHYLLIGENLLF
jgi:hypothetical protein